MSLPDSYTQKPGAIAAYFDAVLDAQPPERFSIKFLENLAFTSTNDRLFIGILKELGFLNADGVPQHRYFDFIDRSQSRRVVADGIREAYSDLFAVNTKANELSATDVKNKLRTLYAGKKTDNVIDRIAKTFAALCEYADFSQPAAATTSPEEVQDKKKDAPQHKKLEAGIQTVAQAISRPSSSPTGPRSRISSRTWSGQKPFCPLWRSPGTPRCTVGSSQWRTSSASE